MSEDLARQELEARMRECEGRAVTVDEFSGLRARAAEKLRLNANLTRPEVAAHLGISVRQVQRMEAAGILKRCPKMGSRVLYAARDVLRLASANGRSS